MLSIFHKLFGGAQGLSCRLFWFVYWGPPKPGWPSCIKSRCWLCNMRVMAPGISRWWHRWWHQSWSMLVVVAPTGDQADFPRLHGGTWAPVTADSDCSIQSYGGCGKVALKKWCLIVCWGRLQPRLSTF